MECYNFEKKISNFLDGEIKQIERKLFIEHKDNCHLCEKKLSDISNTIKYFNEMENFETSADFMDNLNNEIKKIDNEKPILWERIIKIKPFGYDMGPALGLAATLIVIIISSLLLMNKDKIPQIQMNRLTQKSNNASQKFIPSVSLPDQNSASVAESDSSIKSNIGNRYNGKIKLTGGK